MRFACATTTQFRLDPKGLSPLLPEQAPASISHVVRSDSCGKMFMPSAILANKLLTDDKPEKRRPMASKDPFEGLPQASSFTVTSTSAADGKPLAAAQMSGMLG